MLKKLQNYILDNEFKMVVLTNKVDIVNYVDIDHFDSNKIIIRYNAGVVIVKGEDLIISKLLTDEILINGKLKSIEMQWLISYKVKLL